MAFNPQSVLHVWEYLTMPSFAYSDGFNSTPLPFPCDIAPRSAAHAKVIEAEYEEAMAELTSYNAVTNMVS